MCERRAEDVRKDKRFPIQLSPLKKSQKHSRSGQKIFQPFVSSIMP